MQFNKNPFYEKKTAVLPNRIILKNRNPFDISRKCLQELKNLPKKEEPITAEDRLNALKKQDHFFQMNRFKK